MPHDPLAWWRKFRGCSSKQRFETEAQAVAHIRNYPLRPYHCQHCGGYHLTKKGVKK